MATISEELRDIIPDTFEKDGDGYYDTPLTFRVREAADVIDALVAALERASGWLPVMPKGAKDRTNGCRKQIDAALSLARKGG